VFRHEALLPVGSEKTYDNLFGVDSFDAAIIAIKPTAL
jgi:hypothetical protein